MKRGQTVLISAFLLLILGLIIGFTDTVNKSPVINQESHVKSFSIGEKLNSEISSRDKQELINYIQTEQGFNDLMRFAQAQGTKDLESSCTLEAFESDTDGNGAVNIDDIVNVILDFGTDGEDNNGNVDAFQIVNIDDIIQVVLNFGPIDCSCSDDICDLSVDPNTCFVDCQYTEADLEHGSINFARASAMHGDDVIASVSLNSVKFYKIVDGEFVEQSTFFPDLVSTEYGYAVDIYEDWAVVGAFGDNDMGSAAGAVYIYKKDLNGNFEFHEKIYSPDAISGTGFGNAVSIYEDTLVVGANRKNFFKGAVYFFELNDDNWEFKQQFEYPTEFIHFGISVDLNGNRAITGSFGSPLLQGSGAAHIFEKVGEDWQLMEHIIASDVDINNWFGYAVGIDGDKAVVSSILKDFNAPNSGVIYSFEFIEGNWIETQQIVSEYTTTNDHTGITLDLENNYFIAGLPWNSWLFGTALENDGRVAIFYYDDSKPIGERWTELHTIRGSANSIQTLFGGLYYTGHFPGQPTIDIDADRILVGSPGWVGQEPGKIYLFKQ